MPTQPATGPITVAKRDGQAGVIPISTVTDRSKGGSSNAPTRHLCQRLKVVIRRLPPGLSEQEFYTALGEEWKAGSGKVTWANYRPGKVSRDLSKFSKPARCFLQLADPAHAAVLAQHVPKVSFTDARGTQNDPALIGSPQVEYATYGRVPNYKRRNDARQGTIDQDPEFIDFLQSLTAPIQKPKALDPSDMAKDNSIKVTPLIQHLRDKKAAKEKSKTAKAEKQQDDKSENSRPMSSKDAATSKDSKVSSPVKTPAKPATKDVRSPPRNAVMSPKPQPANIAKTTTTPASSTGADRRREAPSPNAAAAARMLQRDLPFQGTRGRAASRGRAGRSPEVRKATLNNATANGTVVPPAASPVPTANAASTPSSTAKPTLSSTTPFPPSNPATQTTPITNPPTGPKSTTANPVPPPRTPPKNIPRDPNAKRAFLKHANASQGITDPVLLAAMRRFGYVTNVSIDNRKGVAYVDFAEPGHLKAAMAASPVPVAQGNVEVLELKNPTRAAVPPPPSYGMPNGVSRGGGGVGQAWGGIGMGPGFRGGRAGVRGRGGRLVGRGAAMVGNPVPPRVVGAQNTPSAPAPLPATNAPQKTGAEAT